MAKELHNSLLSSAKATDSRLQVQLHPLVILTISDYATRHTLRQQPGPIVGAILGSQNGRDITMEFAFDCKLESSPDGEAVLDASWFQSRLQQYRDVHKIPALDLVGWFTLAPPSGPQPHHMPIHQQLLHNHNESILLLTFHPQSLADGTSRGGKLPLTIYETVYEGASEGGDDSMQTTGDVTQLLLRFQELPYTIETGQAEMIGVDFVAKGGANAAMEAEAPVLQTSAKGKAKSRADTDRQINGTSGEHDILAPEDEDMIASLTAKANAIKMLHQRITLIKAYLASIPPCYLNTPVASQTEPLAIESTSQVSQPVLRAISSLLARLPLLTPSASDSAFLQEAAQQSSDVALVTLLGSLGKTLRDAQELGRKSGVVEQARNKTRNAGGAMQPSLGWDSGPNFGSGGPASGFVIDDDGSWGSSASAMQQNGKRKGGALDELGDFSEM